MRNRAIVSILPFTEPPMPMSMIALVIIAIMSTMAAHAATRTIDSVVIAYESYYTLKRIDYLSPIEMYYGSASRGINYITITDSVQMLELATAPRYTPVYGDSCIAGSRMAVRTFYSDGTDDVYGIVGTTIWYQGRCGTVSLMTLTTVLIYLPKEYLITICCPQRSMHSDSVKNK